MLLFESYQLLYDVHEVIYLVLLPVRLRVAFIFFLVYDVLVSKLGQKHFYQITCWYVTPPFKRDMTPGMFQKC